MGNVTAGEEINQLGGGKESNLKLVEGGGGAKLPLTLLGRCSGGQVEN